MNQRIMCVCVCVCVCVTRAGPHRYQSLVVRSRLVICVSQNSTLPPLARQSNRGYRCRSSNVIYRCSFSSATVRTCWFPCRLIHAFIDRRCTNRFFFAVLFNSVQERTFPIGQEIEFSFSLICSSDVCQCRTSFALAASQGPFRGKKKEQSPSRFIEALRSSFSGER